MTELVPTADIERIVDAERHTNLHIARLVAGTVNVLHSHRCVAETPDLRDCRFSRALDAGVQAPDPEDADDAAFLNGHPCTVYVTPAGALRVGEAWVTEPAHVRALATATHRIRDGRAVCDGDATARCHWWPDPAVCDYEQFPCGHDYIDHGECWIIQWLDAGALDDTATGNAPDRYNPDLLGGFPDGLITWTWEDDYVTWDYDTAREDLLAVADAAVATILFAPDHNEQEQ